MNQIYRLVWNSALSLWVAVAENAKGHGKNGRSGARAASVVRSGGGLGGDSGWFSLNARCHAALVMLGTLAIQVSTVYAGPTDGLVVGGTGSIQQSGTATTVNQTSARLAIDWNTFSTKSGESIVFAQPNAASIALNRITGTSASSLMGSLNANGQVFVLNPNGVLFGAGSQVNVGGLVASTLSMSNADFMAGRNVFTNDANSTASVLNQGSLTAAPGGYIALLAPEVRNEGVITATMGTALLAAGNKVSLKLDNGSLLDFSIDKGALNALAENHNLIQADGGQVILSAIALDALSSAAVNNTGVVEARTLQNQAGRIVLTADMDAGQSVQTGTLDVSAAHGGNAGSVRIEAGAVLDAGQVNAASAGGLGGQVSMTAAGGLIQTAQAAANASGALGGGSIALMGNNVFTSAKLGAQGTGTGSGANGGTIDVLAHNQVAVVAAQLDASGTGQGGSIRVGGDFQGTNTSVVNAQTTIVNGASTLTANGGTDTAGGKVIVWSDDNTTYQGKIEARGGAVEVSSKNELQFSGDVVAKTLLLDPKDITISASSGPAAFELIDPNAGTGTNRFFGQVAIALGNTTTTTTAGITSNKVFTPSDRMVVGVASDNGNRGAVYLYDTTTGALLSTLLGSTTNDNVGKIAPTALTNGNYVVTTPTWSNGTIGNAGAVTWRDGNAGSTSGVITSVNSLVGSTANDNIGSNIAALSNGNYVFGSGNWDNGSTGIVNAGAVTFANGLGASYGALGIGNSFVGSTTNDMVGSSATVALTNGNYVARSLSWDNGGIMDAGAMTWGNGTSGSTGAVSVSNSLVGSTKNDQATNQVIALNNGNYVVKNQYWTNGTTTNAGAVTWGDGNGTGNVGGTVGAISASNSLVGLQANDRVGYTSVVALTNGNYVVASGPWNGQFGAATWGNGTGGTVGSISASNSLIGGNVGDAIGANGITALTNGNYVVNSINWSGAGVAQVGAVTWGNGKGGTVGLVSASNSLVGSSKEDEVGHGGVTALNNGNYVVDSNLWNMTFGAVTWGNGVTGTSGLVSTTNSLVGAQKSDEAGLGGVTALSNGNYVVLSTSFNSGGVSQAGAATWGDGTGPTAGVISASNSLLGSQVDDMLGSTVKALNNGNYVVSSTRWDNGSNVDAGAVTWGNGTGGTVGPISASNSLVGSKANDHVGGNGVTLLSDGNYAVTSSQWDNSSISDAGAVTVGNKAGGTVGNITTSNSLIGSQTSDALGSAGVTALTNGNYAVRSGAFNGNTGQVLVGTSGDLPFGTASTQSMAFNPNNIESLLAAGTAVTLQASNDINVNSAINVAGTTGGNLTLQAGRSILFNANVNTANGNLTAIANDPGAIAAQRDTDSGDIVIAKDVSINVGTGTANLSGQKFTNYSDKNALQAIGSGRWMVWSETPKDDARGGLTYNFKQYNAKYGVSTVAQSTGNGFLYTLVPVIFATLTGVTKTYDGNKTANLGSGNFGVSGTVDSDSVTVHQPATGIYDSQDAGTNKKVTASGLSLVSATDAGNAVVYGYTLASDVTTTDAIITKAHLTVYAVNQARLYGEANLALTTSVGGFVNGESISVLSGTGSATTAAIATTDVGIFDIVAKIGGLTATNYDFTGFVNGHLTIGKAHLTVTADDQARLYGQSNAALTTTITGFANGEKASDVTTGAAIVTNVAKATTDVGTSVITVTAGDLKAKNYDFNTLKSGVLTIDKAHLTVTANNQARSYGQSNPALTTTITGFANGEKASDVTTGTATATNGATATTNVGTSMITAGVGDLKATNYDFNTLKDGVLTINKAHLTVTAEDQARLYGQANPSLTTTVTGFVNGEGASVLTGAGSATSVATAATNVGTSAITASAGTLAASNYDFAALASGTLTINKAHLTVTAEDKTRVYGQANPTLTTTLTGFVNGETASGVTTGAATATNAATATTNVGDSVITASAGDLKASNYDFAALTDGALIITPATLTVAADAATRSYGGIAPNMLGKVTGFVNGETALTATTGTEVYSTTATAQTNVGKTDITGAGLTANNGNYVFAQAAGNATALTISKAPLTVTADDKTRVYGQANPPLTTTVTGFVNGESAAVLTGAGVATSTATPATDAGTSVITASAGTLAASNYDFTTLNNGVLNIDKAHLTVAANNDTEVTDGHAFVGGNGVSYRGFLGSDTSSVLEGILHYEGSSQGASAPGSYVIEPFGLTAHNYILDFLNSLLIIKAASNSETALGGTKLVPAYDGVLNGIENIGSASSIKALNGNDGKGGIGCISGGVDNGSKTHSTDNTNFDRINWDMTCGDRKNKDDLDALNGTGTTSGGLQ